MPSEQPGLTLAAPPGPEGDAPSGAPAVRGPAAPNGPGDPRPQERRRVMARRVRRIVRRVDPWSVLKVSLIFYVCGYVVTIVAGVLLWHFAARTGLIDNIEDFVESLGWDRFEFLPDVILQRSLLIGAILTVVLTGMTVLAAVLFNLISDLVGGIRVVVIEEESARPRPVAAGTVSGSGEPEGPPGL